MNQPRRGLFVSIDGPSGVGKTTTCKRVWNYLTFRYGLSVHQTVEPSHTTLGNMTRHNTETYRGHTLACLVAADRYYHIETEIKPRVEAGIIVICDRYVPSSYVLQRMDGVSLEFVAAINSEAPKPDLAVFLEAPASVVAKRVEIRGAHNRFHTDKCSSETEIDLYADTAERLAVSGYPLMKVDTSRNEPGEVAEIIGGRIAEMVRGPSPAPATA